jgi:hypothetical protein
LPALANFAYYTKRWLSSNLDDQRWFRRQAAQKTLPVSEGQYLFLILILLVSVFWGPVFLFKIHILCEHCCSQCCCWLLRRQYRPVMCVGVQ